ncbi:MAG: ATP-binding protein [Acidobacteriaceae bacterium]
MPLNQRSIPITDRSSIGEARRVAVQAAQALGFAEEHRSDIGIVATEAATNILLHAQTGELLVCPFLETEAGWLDLFALDTGRGIDDISRAMEDGFSSAGTAGHGLGAIERLSDLTSLYSLAEKGTAHWSRFLLGVPGPSSSVGVVSIPVRGETKCGDAFFMEIGASRSLYMVVDGLGHGAGATEAAEEAVATVKRSSQESLTEILLRSHNALKKTRGAAMSIAAIDHERQVMKFAGIGNVGALLITGSGSRSLVSQNGTLGVVLPRTTQEYTYPIERNTSLLMFSDGLSTKTSTAGYPGILNRHAALVAGILYRDFGRRRDDATVLFAPIGGVTE